MVPHPHTKWNLALSCLTWLNSGIRTSPYFVRLRQLTQWILFLRCTITYVMISKCSGFVHTMPQLALFSAIRNLRGFLPAL